MKVGATPSSARSAFRPRRAAAITRITSFSPRSAKADICSGTSTYRAAARAEMVWNWKFGGVSKRMAS